ncbi:hypothetical protein AAUPMB_17716 [Pasteurella multocida subsp. multocida str. Anand1_buffalo]|nr:hypothetical protein AAUPMB_17716 [Pasteurella multocida subsp. multocida str. Anand1_buffalo]
MDFCTDAFVANMNYVIFADQVIPLLLSAVIFMTC